VRRLVWTAEAVADLDSIHAYIEQFNPNAARRLGERLIATAATLADHAERGRLVAGGHRELAIIHPYLIRYGIEGDTVYVLRCWHGARDSI
jgi:toxin ParE1/3/4